MADATGDIARITGLKAQPTLNGALCRVLRKAEAKVKTEGEAEAERFVVRSGLKEYALKAANLETGDAVLPGGAQVAAALVLLTALGAVCEIAAQGGRFSLGVAVVPITAAAALFGTLGLCYRLHWPGREQGEWLPSVSELSAPRPSRGVFRTGLLVVGLLLAITTWLQGAIVMRSLEDYVPPPPNATQANVTDGGNVSNVSNATMAAHQRYVDVLANGPEDSVWWGYVAAFSLAAQGIAGFESRLCVKSALHLIANAVFMYAGWQQCVLNTTVLSSPRGAALVAASPGLLARVLTLRQYAVDYLPLVLLAIPLGSQYMSFTRTNEPTTEPPSIRSALRDSGTSKLVGFLQWATMLSYAALCGSFSCELFVASWL